VDIRNKAGHTITSGPFHEDTKYGDCTATNGENDTSCDRGRARVVNRSYQAGLARYISSELGRLEEGVETDSACSIACANSLSKSSSAVLMVCSSLGDISVCGSPDADNLLFRRSRDA
jgi:hypothetical protein